MSTRLSLAAQRLTHWFIPADKPLFGAAFAFAEAAMTEGKLIFRNEVDAFFLRHRHHARWRAGERARVKTGYHRRMRKQARADLKSGAVD